MSTTPIPYSKAAELDPRINTPRPKIDASLVAIVDAFPLPEKLDLGFMRGVSGGGDEAAAFVCNADTVIQSAPQLKHEERSIRGPRGDNLLLSVFSPVQPTNSALPCLYHIHGGGMVAGDRFSGVTQLIELLGDIECVIVSVEYRLAPETRAPGPAEDCYAGLVWISKNASTLGISESEIVVWGISGGGCLAAATCLMARDRKIPKIPIKGQMLLSPMLDDRCESISDKQFEYSIPWCGVTNRMAWECVLGEERGSASITSYQSPSRATDLSNLPPTYVDAAECEVFRDQAVKFATDLWRGGSTCELHVWPGAFHLFDGMDNPDVPLIHNAFLTKHAWLRRIMGTHST
ncbi:unnamed protein product [Clonostachys byssicola]|uniref:Alpha/beta hydrolase fold-3 domain-containing protein n=1 Tax=Clonostachys byssicola TaxID=160290 RepID=A0A9N9UDR9_9HYPO|nr:unnamed protein product [Clonostachys byssicola]